MLLDKDINIPPALEFTFSRDVSFWTKQILRFTWGTRTSDLICRGDFSSGSLRAACFAAAENIDVMEGSVGFVSCELDCVCSSDLFSSPAERHVVAQCPAGCNDRLHSNLPETQQGKTSSRLLFCLYHLFYFCTIIYFAELYIFFFLIVKAKLMHFLTTRVHPFDHMNLILSFFLLPSLPLPAPSIYKAITLQCQINHRSHMWWCHPLWEWKGGACHVHLLSNIPRLLHGCQMHNETQFFSQSASGRRNPKTSYADDMHRWYHLFFLHLCCKLIFLTRKKSGFHGG